jgi:hypothetical protein
MGGPKAPDVAEMPPTPEQKKLVDTDRKKAREAVRQAAISRYGLPSTNVTKGAMGESTASVKKQHLGG